jgi:hypothetical protein
LTQNNDQIYDKFNLAMRHYIMSSLFYHDIKSISLLLNRPPIKFLIAASCHFPTWIQGIPHPWDVVVQRCNNTVARCIVVLRCIPPDYSLAATGRLCRTSSLVPPSQVGNWEACHHSKSLATASAHKSPHRNNYCATLDRGSSCSCFQPWQHLLQLMPSASSCNPADARTRCRAAQMSGESELVISEHNNHGSKIRPVAKPLQGSLRLHIIWASSTSHQ